MIPSLLITHVIRNMYSTIRYNTPRNVMYYWILICFACRRETKCEFGSPCRNLHIWLFLSAQRMSAKHSLGSWFHSTNTLFIGFVYTCQFSVRVHIAQVQCNLLFPRFKLLIIIFFEIIKVINFQLLLQISSFTSIH